MEEASLREALRLKQLDVHYQPFAQPSHPQGCGASKL